MIINHNQAIFDAIVAATGMDPQLGTILISTKKFIDTFNGHRDRKLCTSLDVAQAPMRPTEAMLNAARDWSYKKYGKPIGNDAAIGCWQAMQAVAQAVQQPPAYEAMDAALEMGKPGVERMVAAHHYNGAAYGVCGDYTTVAQEPSGLANLQAIVADQPFQNSALSVYEINLILENKGGFMPDEAVTWFRASRGTFGSAQTPDTSGADGVAVYERGFTDGVFVGREMPQRIPCDKCGKPLHDADQNLRGHKILCDRCVEEPSPAATRDDDARARFLADRADTERKQASNPSSQASTSE
jgi:hypothetical protein